MKLAILVGPGWSLLISTVLLISCTGQEQTARPARPPEPPPNRNQFKGISWESTIETTLKAFPGATANPPDKKYYPRIKTYSAKSTIGSAPVNLILVFDTAKLAKPRTSSSGVDSRFV